MKRIGATEAELGGVLVAHLHALGAEVWQEVEVSGGVADVVARFGVEYWVFELKTSLSLALVLQAMDRRRVAHRVVIAAPYTRHMGDVELLCRELGIGLWSLHPAIANCDSGNGFGQPTVQERAHGRRWNSRPVALATRLTEQHKTYAKAGSVGAGGRWTAYRNTCEELARLVHAKPGLTLKAAIDETKHHYRTPKSARSSLATWIKEGKVPGVRMVDGALYPAEARR